MDISHNPGKKYSPKLEEDNNKLLSNVTPRPSENVTSFNIFVTDITDIKCTSLLYYRIFNKYAVKCYYKDDITLITLDSICFNSLFDKITQIYGKYLDVKYVNSKNDIIIINNTEKLRHCYHDWLNFRSTEHTTQSWKLYLYR